MDGHGPHRQRGRRHHRALADDGAGADALAAEDRRRAAQGPRQGRRRHRSLLRLRRGVPACPHGGSVAEQGRALRIAARRGGRARTRAAGRQLARADRGLGALGRAPRLPPAGGGRARCAGRGAAPREAQGAGDRARHQPDAPPRERSVRHGVLGAGQAPGRRRGILHRLGRRACARAFPAFAVRSRRGALHGRRAGARVRDARARGVRGRRRPLRHHRAGHERDARPLVG